MDKNLYKFGMDWLNGVLPVYDVWDVFELLKMFSSKLRFERWQLTNSGMYNYSRRYCLDGKSTIQLMYNPVSDEQGFTACQPLPDTYHLLPESEKINYHNNSGIFFSISGDGIRYLHSLGGEVSALNKLLFYFYRHSFKASRFDTYCDILDEDNTIVPLIQEAFSYVGKEQVGKPCISTRIRRDRKVNASDSSRAPLRKNFRTYTMQDDEGNDFTNCQLGHHASTVGMFRCYNKKIEMRDSRLSEFSAEIARLYDVDTYWYRLEYEMHKDNAGACFNALMSRAEEENSPLCFEDIFFSVFDKVFKIVVLPQLSYKLGDSPCSPIWTSFRDDLLSNTEYLVQFGGVPYIDNSIQRLDNNMERISSYVYLCLQRLLSLSPEERFGYLIRGSDKFNSNFRYNSIRDEIDILPLKEIQNRLEKFGLIA